MRNLLLLLIPACLLFSTGGFSQSSTITGRIISSIDKLPVTGVTVTQKGTRVATATDEKGSFRLSVPSDAVLVISSVNYETQEISVNGKTILEITLQPSSASLEQVVVVGYGTVRKKDLTGSVGQVKAAEINAFPTTNVLQALSGRTPGVEVKQNTGAPGAPLQVRIRGANSVQGSNEPLYVVDGFLLGSGTVNMLNNSDIESVEILKDASASAIYGSRGANGVVIITTKQGKAGSVKVDYEGSYAIQSVRKKLELMNAKEYGEFYNMQAKNDNLPAYFTQDQINGFQDYDWQDLIYRKAPLMTHSVTASGGSDKTRFSVGATIFDQDGIIVGSNYRRYTLRANITSDISKKFSIAYGTTLTNVESDRQNSGAGNRGGSLISSVLTVAPFINPFKADGTLTDTRTPPFSFIGPIIHPLNYIREQTDKENSNITLANLAFVYKPFSTLTVRIAGGLENNDGRFDAYTSTNFPGSQGVATVSTTRFRSLLNENTVSYINSFGKHSLNAVAGFTYQNFSNTALGGSGTGFLSNVTETYSLNTSNVPGIPSSRYDYATQVSFLGRINYNFNDKYLATVSFRGDGSSRYSPGEKWGYYPSAALAWRVSKEPFLKDVAFISDLKARAGWGVLGNQAIAAYSTLNLLQPGRTVFGDALYNSYAPGTRLPASLKWESTRQADFGIDAAFVQNKYRLTLDYYIKDTYDLLNTVQLPSGFGYTSVLQNVGQIRNQGLEITAGATLLQSKAFRWELNGNIAFNRSKVIALAGGKDILGGVANVTVVNDNTNLLRVGLPVGVFYGYQENGYTSTGRIAYRDNDGNNAINLLDKAVIGNPNPDYIFGLNSTMEYKGLELTMFWQGSQGNDIVNVSSIGNTLDYSFGLNLLKEVYNNNWSSAKPDAKYPYTTRSLSLNFSDRFVEDGSFVRLRNIQLAYNLPLASFGIKAIRTARVYVSGQNLLTFTSYSWFDPEVNSQGGASSIGQGIDHYSYPTAKMVTFGLQVGF